MQKIQNAIDKIEALIEEAFKLDTPQKKRTYERRAAKKIASNSMKLLDQHRRIGHSEWNDTLTNAANAIKRTAINTKLAGNQYFGNSKIDKTLARD